MATTVPASTSTTVAPVPQLPAGAQFLAAPIDVTSFRSATAELDGTTVAIGGSSRANTSVTVESASGSVEVTLPQPATPDGYPLAESAAFATAIAAGPSGFVIVGIARFRTSGLGGYTYSAATWHSADGAQWTLADLGAIVADHSTVLHSVTATPTGYIAVGASGRRAGATPTDPDFSRGLVLTSTDGATWSQATAPEVPMWSVGLDQVQQVGDRVVLAGTEFVCILDGGALAYTGSAGHQTRLWTSDASMTTWQQVDLSATGLPLGAEPPPADTAGCPPYGADGALPTDELNRRFADSLDIHFVDDRVIAISRPSVAVSTDLNTWATAELPGALPASAVNAPAPSPPAAVLLTAEDGALVYVSVESSRDENDAQVFGKYQPIVWTSADSGATWDRLPPAGRSVAFGGSVALVAHDGAVQMYATFPTGSEHAVRYESVAGPVQPVDATCEPAAAADCFSVALESVDLGGATLDGIDFRAANLQSLDFTGASLVGARFTGAYVNSDFSGANLSGADLEAAYVNETLFAAGSLTSAHLTGIIMYWASPTPVAVDLSGVDLTNGSIAGRGDGVLQLTITAAAGANLTGFSFGAVDLSGSNLSGANLSGVRFDSTVICPDGAPPTPGVYEAAACRL
ncbi:MAG: pentapeptide repeat-containing protein [Ilumatobacteraceae bacterium]